MNQFKLSNIIFQSFHWRECSQSFVTLGHTNTHPIYSMTNCCESLLIHCSYINHISRDFSSCTLVGFTFSCALFAREITPTYMCIVSQLGIHQCVYVSLHLQLRVLCIAYKFLQFQNHLMQLYHQSLTILIFVLFQNARCSDQLTGKAESIGLCTCPFKTSLQHMR